MANLIVYENGLRVVVEKVPYMRSVSVGIWVKAGSIYENAENNGISHFTEHMLFKGTDKLSAFEIAKKFEDKGASVNAFTGRESTCYFFKSVDTQIEDCFSVLSEIFFDSTFDKVELDRERKVIVEEINMVEDTPEDICYDLSAEALFGGHSLAQTILGTKDNVLRFGKDDIQRYMSERYLPQNIVVTFAGNVDENLADTLVKKYFYNKLLPQKPTLEPTNAEYRFDQKIRIDDFEQSNMIISYPSVCSSDEGTVIQNYANIILGASMSSRLFQEVREKQGLAYSVYTSPSTYIKNGSFNICLNTNPENMSRAVDATFKVINEVKNNGVLPSEFERAREQLKSSLVFAQENVQSIMLAMGKSLITTDKCFDIEEKLQKIDSITQEEVEKFINQLFEQKYAWAYVGKQCDFIKNNAK